MAFTESTIEEAALEWLKDMGHVIAFGCDFMLKNTLASLRDRLSMPKLIRSDVHVKEKIL